MVSDTESGGRIDKFIASKLPNVSRTRIQTLIDAGFVLANGATCRPKDKIRPGMEIEITIPPPEETDLKPENIPLNIVYEDAHIIVIDKPAGLVVHPGVGNLSGTVVNALMYHCPDIEGVGSRRRPGVVHRIDKDTSGLLVFSKTSQAHESLTAQFKDHSVIRRYRALVFGRMPQLEGTIDTMISRHPADRKKFTSKTNKGKRAITHWWVVQDFCSLVSLLEFKLETGRTHQIRVHLSEFGHPILGDPVYGQTQRRLAHLPDTEIRQAIEHLKRQALHAYLLGFIHPHTGKEMLFESPMPEDMQTAITKLDKISRRCQ